MNDLLASESTSLTLERLKRLQEVFMAPISEPRVEVLTLPVEASSAEARAVAAEIDEARCSQAACATAMEAEITRSGETSALMMMNGDRDRLAGFSC